MFRTGIIFFDFLWFEYRRNDLFLYFRWLFYIGLYCYFTIAWLGSFLVRKDLEQLFGLIFFVLRICIWCFILEAIKVSKILKLIGLKKMILYISINRILLKFIISCFLSNWLTPNYQIVPLSNRINILRMAHYNIIWMNN